MSVIQLYNGDCLDIMDRLIKDGIKVDAIITDEPFGTTACKWDCIIPFNEMWDRLEKIRKEKAGVILFGSQPFTSKLICSNLKNFKYEWIWEKAVGSNFACVKYQPLKEHENILVFYSHNYYPIKEQRKGSGGERLKNGYKSNGTISEVTGILSNRKGKTYDALKFPSSIQYFNNRDKYRGLHPTQKPVALMEYLVKTYTNEGDTVLDFTMGCGTTGVACKNLNRSFIGIELDKKYFNITQKRLISS